MKKIGLATIFTLLLINQVYAMPPAFLLGDCAQTAEKFCEAESGEAFRMCMGNHYIDATPGCQKDMLSRAEESGGCAYDRLAFCAALKTGTGAQYQGKLEACFRENWDKLKPACTARIDKMMLCEEDVKKHCMHIMVGSGKITQCLRGAKPQLSQQCITSLGAELDEPSWYQQILQWWDGI